MRHRPALVPLTLLLVLATAMPAGATFPFPPQGGDPYDYTKLHITNGTCPPTAGSDLPRGFDCRAESKLTDYAPQPGEVDHDPTVESNPQELFGRKGPGTNRAWELTTGRPDTLIAELDSGILWSQDTPELVNKFFLNRGELPVPCTAAPCSTTFGGSLQTHDVNHDGVFNVADYANDPRAHDFTDDRNNYLDPADLIRTFSDGADQDADGYTDDIAGWDFFEDDNNPGDDVEYGHGTGEVRDSSAEIERHVTQCPNCTVMPLRVGDSFVADIDDFAEAVVYAVDRGASIVQEALGTYNHTAFAQAAVDYAYRNGVLVVASEADEEAGHHNYPAALNHTMVVNSLTHYATVPDTDAPAEEPLTYLAFNGCTNFGGYTWLSVESNSCSSDATGQSAGMAGLLYSEARNAVDHGILHRSVAGRPLSAEEAKQLLRIAADPIDFSTPDPPGPPNNFGTTLPDSMRYVTTAGWDQITGWGRLNIQRAVNLVARGRIPPEADLTSPLWWQSLPETGHVSVMGRVAAPRAGLYAYRVQFAPGVQPPRWPAAETWTTVASGTGTSPKQGVLASMDLAAVRAAIDAAVPPYTPADDPTSPDLPEQDAFRVRMVVCAGVAACPSGEALLESSPSIAIEQRQLFSHDDPTLLPGWPRHLNADGAGSPAFADLTGDGVDELVVSDGNGFVHTFRADGAELPGWPVHTDPIPLPHSGTNAYTRGQVPATVDAAILLGSPLVADLDGDGTPEVAVGAIDGKLYVWHSNGTRAAGFPVTTDPDYSVEPGCQTAIGPACDDWSSHDVRDPHNTVFRGFAAPPAAGDLDPSHPGLELVAGAMDDHVYTFHADGTQVAGWPVLIVDPVYVQAVDPVTHEVTYTVDLGELRQRKIISTPTLGDVDGDGTLEVAVNVNEQFAEDPNWTLRDPSLQSLRALGTTGNTRVYLLYADGTDHPATAGQQASANPDDQAYVAGWPARIGMATTQLLPDVGEGSNGSPVMADVDGDGTLEIGTASIDSPPYLLKANGSSFYGADPQGHAVTMATSADEFKSGATDGPSLAAIGGGVFGRLGGPGSPVSFAMGASGLRRLLDVVLPEQQLGAEDHIGAWNALTGTYDPGFPSRMNDLMFFNTPAVADVSGDGLAEVLQASAMYDLRAYGLGGAVPGGWPKFTGGWSVTTPATGDLNGDGKLDVAMMSREGWLFVWSSAGDACQPQEWPKFQHDLHNTGAYGTDAEPPAGVRALTATRANGAITVSWTAPGDDGICGTARRYQVRVNGGHSAATTPPDPATAGTRQTMTIPDPRGRIKTVTVSAVDEAGNRNPTRLAKVV